MTNAKDRVLISPLDWGLGHTTRSIPLIYRLLKEQKQVLLAGDGSSADLLRQHFPDLPFVYLPGYRVRYARHRHLTLALLWQLPKLLWAIYREKRFVKQIVWEYGIDQIIADNRYGCRHPECESIIITHQLHIALPKSLRILSPLIDFLHHRLIKRFDYCWVPDFEGDDNLAGQLSHPRRIPAYVRYIGVLSRFSIPLEGSPLAADLPCKLLVIISGPEPQRQQFEDLVLKQAVFLGYPVMLVRGLPACRDLPKGVPPNVLLFNHLPDKHLKYYIQKADCLVCRSGYSSIMDLWVLGKQAVLVPTPGQAEQEYLAAYLENKPGYYIQKQSSFSLIEAVRMMKDGVVNKD